MPNFTMNETSRASDTPKPAAEWVEILNQACAKHRQALPPAVGRVNPVQAAHLSQLQELTEQAVKEYPRDFHVLYLAALAALLENNPARCRRYLQRLEKHYYTDNSIHLLRAIAIAQQGVPLAALQLLREVGMNDALQVIHWFLGDDSLELWLLNWLKTIYTCEIAPPSKPLSDKPRNRKTPKAASHAQKSVKTDIRQTHPVPEMDAIFPELPDLPKFQPDIPIRFDIVEVRVTGKKAEVNLIRNAFGLPEPYRY